MRCTAVPAAPLACRPRQLRDLRVARGGVAVALRRPSNASGVMSRPSWGRTPPTVGRVPRSQGLTGEFDQGVGAALHRGARVIGGDRAHQRVQRGQQGGAALEVEASRHGEQGSAPGDRQRPSFAGVRVGVGAVWVDVGPDAVTGLGHLARAGGGGHVGEDLVQRRHRVDAHVADQVADGADLFRGHGAGVRGRGQGGQLASSRPRDSQPDAAPWLIRPKAISQDRAVRNPSCSASPRVSNETATVESTAVSWLATVSSDSSPSRTCSSDHDVTSSRRQRRRRGLQRLPWLGSPVVSNTCGKSNPAQRQIRRNSFGVSLSPQWIDLLHAMSWCSARRAGGPP